MSKATYDVIRERRYQIEDEGYTAEVDDSRTFGELPKAAAGYAYHAADVIQNGDMANHDVPLDWPWDAEWWKPKEPRRDLVLAAALIIAEIERLDRLHDANRGPDTK